MIRDISVISVLLMRSLLRTPIAEPYTQLITNPGQRWSCTALTRAHYTPEKRECVTRILKQREKSLLYGVSPPAGADVHRDRNVADGCRIAGVLDSGAGAMKIDPMIAVLRD
jgi:hypothetical protein